ncbi:MAG TPA: Hpt domain-containing protein [Gemmata sp.]
MLDPQDEMLAVFLDESAENLSALEQGLLQLDRDPADRGPLDRVFRAAHSIKGGSSFFGIEAVTRLAHAMENVLDRVRAGVAPSTRRKVDLLLKSADMLGRFLAATRAGGCPVTGHEALVAELHHEDEHGTAAAPPSGPVRPDPAPAPGAGPSALADYIAAMENLTAWSADALPQLRTFQK